MTEIQRKPQGGVYAQVKARGNQQAGRAWVESINSAKETALVRFDPGLGMRSRATRVYLVDVDFGPVGWDGWR